MLYCRLREKIEIMLKYYKEKCWSMLELRSALCRAFKDKKEYILPIILDEIDIDEIHGLNATTGYLKASEHTSNEIADYVEEKTTREINIFEHCRDISNLFKQAIIKIWEISETDYNQIILYAATGSHTYGLVVVADIISRWKQRYRLTAMDGVINKCYKSGKTINIVNVNNEQSYFTAVCETQSELLIPIKRLGNIIGIINIESEKINYFSLDMVNEIEAIAKHFGDMLHKMNFDNEYYKNIPYVSIVL